MDLLVSRVHETPPLELGAGRTRTLSSRDWVR